VLVWQRSASFRTDSKAAIISIGLLLARAMLGLSAIKIRLLTVRDILVLLAVARMNPPVIQGSWSLDLLVRLGLGGVDTVSSCSRRLRLYLRISLQLCFLCALDDILIGESSLLAFLPLFKTDG